MKNHRYIVLVLTGLLVLGCSEERLEPDPQSFFSPENTLIDRAGIEAIIEWIIYDKTIITL